MAKYSDLNTFYTSTNPAGPVLVDIKDIQQGLERLFTTGKGEVPFNRNYGTTLKSLLFENGVDAEDVKMFLYMDITDFEPRIIISPTDLSIVQVDNNSFEVSCTFLVPGLNNQIGKASATITNN